MEEHTTRTFELLEPASPEALVPPPWIQPWMIAIAIGLLAGTVFYLVLRRVFRKKSHPVPPRLRAYRTAKQALSPTVFPETPRDAAIAISLILRRYLADASGDPALFETHEEFVARHDSLGGLPDEAKAAVASAFSRLAAIKYAAHPPAADSRQLYVEAAELLETLHHGNP